MKLIAEETILALESAPESERILQRKRSHAGSGLEKKRWISWRMSFVKSTSSVCQKKCVPESGVVFLDLISNLERIADHATNIAGYVVSEAGKGLPCIG